MKTKLSNLRKTLKKKKNFSLFFFSLFIITLTPNQIYAQLSYDREYVSVSNLSNNNFIVPEKKIKPLVKPIFTMQPINVDVCEGGSSSFSVNTSSASEVSYQWQRFENLEAWNNINDNEIYSGTTSKKLTLTDIPISFDEYEYRCTATNESGSNQSNKATLYVNATPIVITEDDKVTDDCSESISGTAENAEWTEWSLVSGYGDIINIYELTTDVENLNQGINVFRLTGYTESNCLGYDDIQIEATTIFATAEDINVCTENAILTGNIPEPGRIGLWTITNGDSDIIINEPESYNSTVMNIMSYQTNILRWTVTSEVCAGYVEIEVNNNFVSTYAGEDYNVCSDMFSIAAETPARGTGIWTVLVGGGIIENTSTNYTNVYNMDKGDNIYLWTLTYKNCSASDDVKIRNQIPTEANIQLPLPENREVCKDSVSLTANNPVIGTGSWEINSTAPSLFTNKTNYITDVINLQHGQNEIQWIITGEDFCQTIDNIIIINKEVTATTGDNLEICDTFHHLYANEPFQGTFGYWIQTEGNAVINNSLYHNSSVNQLSEGLNRFRWTVQNDICSDYAEMDIINNKVIATATDQTTCNGTVTLDGNLPQEGTIGLWTKTSDEGIITTPSLYNTTVTDIPKETEIELTWSLMRGECSDAITIYAKNNNFDLSAGEDSDGCFNSYELHGDLPTPGTGNWYIIEGNGDFLNNSINNTTVENLSQGENIFEWTVTKDECTNSAQVTITNNLPDEAIIELPLISDRIICEPTAFLQANNPVFGNGEWIANNSAIFTDATSYQTEVTNLANGNNIIKWEIINEDCTSEDNIIIINNEVTANAGGLQNICIDNTQLEAEVSSQGVGHWIVLSGTGIIENSLLNSSFVTNIQLGINIFRWTVELENCIEESDVEVWNNSFTINAGDDEAGCFANYILNGEDPAPGNGYWETAGEYFILDNTLYNSQVLGLEQGQNIFVWNVIRNDCESSAQVIITNNLPDSAKIYSPTPEENEICQEQLSLEANNPIIGTGEWSVYDDNIIIENPSNFITQATGLPENESIFVWTTTNIDCSLATEITVINNSVNANAGEDIWVYTPDQGNPITTADIEAEEPISPSYGIWTSEETGIYFESSLSAVTIVNGLNIGDNLLKWTVYKGTCYADDELTVSSGFFIQSNNTVLEWNDANDWLPPLVPTDADSVVISNSTASIIGYDAYCGSLYMEQTAYLNIEEDAEGTQGNLFVNGQLTVINGADKYSNSKGETTLRVGSGGNVIIEQNVEKGNTIGLKIGSGGNVIIEQNVEKSKTNSASLTVREGKTIFVSETNPDGSNSEAFMYIKDGGNVIIEQNVEKISKDEPQSLYVGNGGNVIIEQNVEKTKGDAVLTIEGGGNVIIEQNVEKGEGGKMRISGGNVIIEQNVEKGGEGKMLISGGNVIIEQNVEKGEVPGIVEVPIVEILDGTLILSNNSQKNKSYASLRTGNVIIEQNVEKSRTNGEPNFVIGETGQLNFFELPENNTSAYLMMNENSSVTIQEGGTVNVEVVGKPLVFAEEGASLVDFNPEGAIIGEVIVEQIFEAELDQLLTPPVDNVNSELFDEADLFFWEEEQANWQIFPTQQELSVMQAYSVEFPTNSTIEFTGELNYGNQSIGISNTGSLSINEAGWNLVGNPYIATIDWETIEFSGVEPTVYVYNTETNNYSIYQKGGATLNEKDQYVSALTGFFVKATPEATNVTFNLIPDNQVHDIPGLLKINPLKTFDNALKLNVAGNGYNDQSLLRFDNSANLEFNSGLDAFKFLAVDMEVPQLYTVGSDGSYLAINVLNAPENDVTTTIPLNFESAFDGIYTIQVNEITIGNEYDIYLKDLVTTDIINLKEVSTYEFDWTASDDAERFELLFDSHLSIDEPNNNYSNENIEIYSHGQKLFISAENTKGVSTIEIYNVIGQKLFSKIISSDGKYSYDLEYSTGNYFVKIITANNVVSEKIIIVK